METLLKQPGQVATSKVRETPPPALELIRSEVDQALGACVQHVRERFDASRAGWVVDQVERMITAGGSRMRPLLCCCGYAAVGGEGGATDPRIVRVASSLELLQTFAILHDDVMDGSATRRGTVATHLLAEQEGRRARHVHDAERYGYSMAVLAGDLALVMSDLMLAESGFDPALIVKGAAPLADMRLDAIAGQYLDLRLSGDGSSGQHTAVLIADLKTASYSVRGPLMLGATFGKGTHRAMDALSRYARSLGRAYQYADDMIGLLGDASSTGKDAENDLRQGRPTLLIARTFALAPPQGRKTIRSLWGKPNASEEEISELRSVVRESGAVRSLMQSMETLVAEARQSLVKPAVNDLEPSACRLLTSLADSVLARVTGLQ